MALCLMSAPNPKIVLAEMKLSKIHKKEIVVLLLKKIHMM